MKLMNLTPHAISIETTGGKNPLVVQPSGVIARVSSSTESVRTLSVDEGITFVNVVRTTFGEIENLPAPADDTMYIVSSLVKSRCPNRDDVMVPGVAIRDTVGVIVGCRGLSL